MYTPYATASAPSAFHADVRISMDDDSTAESSADAGAARAGPASPGAATARREFQDVAQWVDAQVRVADPQQMQVLADRLRTPHPARAGTVYIEIGDTTPHDAAVASYLATGHEGALPSELRDGIRAATGGFRPASAGVSGRLMALLAGLRHVATTMDAYGPSRTALNFGHTTLRSLGSVGLTTLARQAVGRALDIAMARGTSELTRTLIGAGAMAMPVAGQLLLMWRDERNQNATTYSRLTRLVLMGLSIATGGMALATGTLTNPGLRLAEVVLYPLLRDAVQAMFPIVSDPDSGPTKTSLGVAGASYAVNQLAVSRAFVAAPDAGPRGLILSGLLARSAANAAGESVDLMSLLGANHVARHGVSTQPRLRIGRGDLWEAVKTQLHWDTMAARGGFVSAFNQIYDTLLADHMLPQAMVSVVGPARALAAADWTTEAIAALMTAATYPFWTDALHARGYAVTDDVEAQRATALPDAPWDGDDSETELRPIQYAGNHTEPAVAKEQSPVVLLSVCQETDELRRHRSRGGPAGQSATRPDARPKMR
jgi:hypothetical protein